MMRTAYLMNWRWYFGCNFVVDIGVDVDEIEILIANESAMGKNEKSGTDEEKLCDCGEYSECR